MPSETGSDTSPTEQLARLKRDLEDHLSELRVLLGSVRQSCEGYLANVLPEVFPDAKQTRSSLSLAEDLVRAVTIEDQENRRRDILLAHTATIAAVIRNARDIERNGGEKISADGVVDGSFATIVAGAKDAKLEELFTVQFRTPGIMIWLTPKGAAQVKCIAAGRRGSNMARIEEPEFDGKHWALYLPQGTCEANGAPEITFFTAWLGMNGEHVVTPTDDFTLPTAVVVKIMGTGKSWVNSSM